MHCGTLESGSTPMGLWECKVLTLQFITGCWSQLERQWTVTVQGGLDLADLAVKWWDIEIFFCRIRQPQSTMGNWRIVVECWSVILKSAVLAHPLATGH